MTVLPWLLSVAALFALLLAIPLELWFAVESERGARPRWRARLSWLFGVIRLELPSGRAPETPPGPRAAARAAEAPARPGGPEGRRAPVRRRLRQARRLLESPGLVRRLRRFLARFLRALSPRDLSVDAQVGLEDPAATGRLWAFLGPVAAILHSRWPDAHIMPDFAEESLDLRGRVRFAIVPLELVAVTLAFALSPVVVRAGIALWRA